MRPTRSHFGNIAPDRIDASGILRFFQDSCAMQSQSTCILVKSQYCAPMARRNPVDVVIAEFGTMTEVARVVNRNIGAVSKWRRRGLIPNEVQAAILDAAKARGINVSAEDLIRGRTLETD